MFRPVVVLMTVFVLAGCASVQNSLAERGVRDHKTKAGMRVMVAQLEPKTDYRCQKLSQEAQAWGLKGRMMTASAYQNLVEETAERAASQNANYVHVMLPGDVGVMGVTVTAFSDAQVAYFKCTNLPTSASSGHSA
jgi:hypothetical protein